MVMKVYKAVDVEELCDPQSNVDPQGSLGQSRCLYFIWQSLNSYPCVPSDLKPEVKLGKPCPTHKSVVFLHCCFPQVKVSSAVLKAAAHHYGAQCDKPNKEFMLCRWEEKDPRRCLEEGKLVNQCALKFFR